MLPNGASSKKAAIKKTAPLRVRREPATTEGSDRGVDKRWTPRLAANFTPVADYFLANYHRLKITHTEAMVIIHLMSFKWDANAPYPSLKTIAKRMGITTPSVRTHLRNLERKGFLRREMQVGTTNRFHLQGLFRALEMQMEVDAKRE